jgi:hypothetical protein
VDQYIAELAGQRDEAGRRLVVRNGRHRPRTVTTAAGPIEVAAPRVNDKRVDETTDERQRFSSKILAPWCRKSPKISEVLPLLYLHGLSSGDFVPAMALSFCEPNTSGAWPAGQRDDRASWSVGAGSRGQAAAGWPGACARRGPQADRSQRSRPSPSSHLPLSRVVVSRLAGRSSVARPWPPGLAQEARQAGSVPPGASRSALGGKASPTLPTG